MSTNIPEVPQIPNLERSDNQVTETSSQAAPQGGIQGAGVSIDIDLDIDKNNSTPENNTQTQQQAQQQVQQAQTQEQNNKKAVSIENVMQATFGEDSEEVRASFKKTVLIRQYETEVIEAESVLKFSRTLSGAERMLISAMLQVQLEYTAYCQLLFKGLITSTELRQHREGLEQGISQIKEKAEIVLGKSLDEYINTKLG